MKGLRNPFACLRSSPGSVGAGISYSTAGKIRHLPLDPRPHVSDVGQSLFPLPLRSAYPKPLHLN